MISDTENIRIIKNDDYSYPWDTSNPPVSIELPARKVLNWSLKQVESDGGTGMDYHIPAFPDDPEFSDKTETIKLIPYGCTMLRVTVFPKVEE